MQRDALIIFFLFGYFANYCDAQIIPQPDTVYVDSTGTLVADGQYWFQGEIRKLSYVSNEIVLYFNETISQTQKDSLIQEFDLIEIRKELSSSDPYIFCTQDRLAALVARAIREHSSVEYVYPLSGNHGRRKARGHLHHRTDIVISVEAEWDSLQISAFEEEYGLHFLEYSVESYIARLSPAANRHILEVVSTINWDTRVRWAFANIGGSLNPIGLQADFDHDGKVGFQDLLIFVQHYGKEFQCRTKGIDCDLDFNYKVDFYDFLRFVQSFNDFD